MRLVNTVAHGLFDYAIALFLFASPFFFNYAAGSPAHRITTAIALIILCNSIVTKLELSPIKLIPLRAHLFCDVLLGILLAASPWIFHFEDKVFKPQLVFGLTVAVVSLLTDRIPTIEVMQMMGKSRAGKKTKQVKTTASLPLKSFIDIKFIYDSADTHLTKALRKAIGLSSK